MNPKALAKLAKAAKDAVEARDRLVASNRAAGGKRPRKLHMRNYNRAQRDLWDACYEAAGVEFKDRWSLSGDEVGSGADRT